MALFRDIDGNFFDIPREELDRYRVEREISEDAEVTGQETDKQEAGGQDAGSGRYIWDQGQQGAAAYNYQGQSAYNYQSPAFKSPAHNYESSARLGAAAYNYESPGAAAYNYAAAGRAPAYNYADRAPAYNYADRAPAYNYAASSAAYNYETQGAAAYNYESAGRAAHNYAASPAAYNYASPAAYNYAGHRPPISTYNYAPPGVGHAAYFWDSPSAAAAYNYEGPQLGGPWRR